MSKAQNVNQRQTRRYLPRFPINKCTSSLVVTLNHDNTCAVESSFVFIFHSFEAGIADAISSFK